MHKPNKKSSQLSIPKASAPQQKGNGQHGSLLSVHQQKEISKFREEKVMFSYYFLDTAHEAFNCGGGIGVNWFLQLFDNLREISKLNRNEFVVQQRNHYDVHSHDFENTAYHYADRLPEGYFEQLSEDQCLQFRLSSSGGRVHGFMIENTFYVLWLDPHHNMYPDQRFGGLQFFNAPLTPYQELQIELEEWKKKHADLASLLDELTAPGA
ncbi:hypothetical protein [Brevibacillus centrosporus]|uniref:hypothetical protein n=1 Tax=Brevibacillus centrosporus TaxID=54910 RepID=UPI003B020D6E